MLQLSALLSRLLDVDVPEVVRRAFLPEVSNVSSLSATLITDLEHLLLLVNNPLVCLLKGRDGVVRGNTIFLKGLDLMFNSLDG
jgi:hypothetical protein